MPLNTTEWINNWIQVDRYARINLAHLRYIPDSDRPDDCGGLYVAPVVQVRGSKVPPGQLCLFATTNGDPIRLGFITNGQIEFVRSTDIESGMDEEMLRVLKRASWNHPKNGEGYSFLVEDVIGESSVEALQFL